MNEEKTIDAVIMPRDIFVAAKKNGWKDSDIHMYLHCKYGVTNVRGVLTEDRPELARFFANTHISQILADRPAPEEPLDGQIELITGRVYSRTTKQWEGGSDE